MPYHFRLSQGHSVNNLHIAGQPPAPSLDLDLICLAQDMDISPFNPGLKSTIIHGVLIVLSLSIKK